MASDLADRVKTAMETADLDALFSLLAPDARWGPPGDDVSGCHNRDEVRSWYQAAFDRGVRAKVTEVVSAGDHVLLGLSVNGGPDRWQVLTIRDGLIADIRGFDERPEIPWPSS